MPDESWLVEDTVVEGVVVLLAVVSVEEVLVVGVEPLVVEGVDDELGAGVELGVELEDGEEEEVEEDDWWWPEPASGSTYC